MAARQCARLGALAQAPILPVRHVPEFDHVDGIEAFHRHGLGHRREKLRFQLTDKEAFCQTRTE